MMAWGPLLEVSLLSPEGCHSSNMATTQHYARHAVTAAMFVLCCRCVFCVYRFGVADTSRVQLQHVAQFPLV